MDKQIPVYFDSVIVSSQIQEVGVNDCGCGRLKVRVFTKYGNRNGSYITDAVAQQLIESATGGHTPVVGFFDPETQTWASHTGPTLANAYGYVESFLGWEPFEDTDGVTREYAVFSVILFTKYFDEAKKIMGQNQSMELDINSITGDWAEINGEYYYVYTTAKMLGFCIIGSHEPCFSVSAFFSKFDENYATQYDKFSSLLSGLHNMVEEAEKISKGGEHTMDENMNQVTPEETPTVIEEVTAFEAETPVEEPVVEEVVTEEVEEPKTEFEVVEEVEETQEIEVAVEVEDTPVEPSEFEVLQKNFDELQNSYNELNTKYEELAKNLKELNDANISLKETVAQYEAKEQAENEIKKEKLISDYENVLSEEEISSFKSQSKDISYDELEGKLAIAFAHKQMNGGETVKKVPLPEPEESQFALLMKKYRKN